MTIQKQTAHSGMPMVRLEGVAKNYDGVTALQGTDLQVEKGEFLTLLGPSGSGKTTLLNIISGMIDPSVGRVFIDGSDVTGLPSAKRELGMVFQSYALMPHMTVFDNIAFPLRIRKVSVAEIRRRVLEVLDLVQLAHLADRKPRALSGGQQQRISLARCIVYNPRLILMDEPLGALDKKLREQMQLEIMRLHTRLGITMIYVTHDQEEALTMSDRIVLMNNARIEQTGAPDDLYFSPRSVFAAEFIGQSNLLEARVVDRASVRLRGGLVVAARADGIAPPGRDARLLVRPESLRLADAGRAAGDPGQGLDNLIPGVAVSSMIVGSLIKHYVDVGESSPIVVQELSSADARAPAPGEKVMVGWSVKNSRLLAD